MFDRAKMGLPGRNRNLACFPRRAYANHRKKKKRIYLREMLITVISIEIFILSELKKVRKFVKLEIQDDLRAPEKKCTMSMLIILIKN